MTHLPEAYPVERKWAELARREEPQAALQAVGAHPTAPTIAEPEPELLIAARLINDADTQAKWYYRLKREHRRARAEGRPFQNPIEPRTDG